MVGGSCNRPGVGPGISSQDMEPALLRGVARTFALSLQVLPKAVRPEVALAYVWARLSDTLADDVGLPAAEAVELIGEVEGWHGSGCAGGGRLAARIARVGGDVARPAERELLERTEEWMERTRQLDEGARGRMRDVLGVIFSGQCFDLEFFRLSGGRVLANSDALLDYAWRVAGCVGEYWTAVLAARVPGSLRMDAEKLAMLGREYGIGLQLVNILRDAPEDWRAGRCYLPGQSEGDWPEDLEELHRRMGDWVGRCGRALASGVEYAKAVRGWRVRVASGLPVALALPTLDRVASSSLEEWMGEVRIAKRDVRRAGLRVLAGRWKWAEEMCRGF